MEEGSRVAATREMDGAEGRENELQGMVSMLMNTGRDEFIPLSRKSWLSSKSKPGS